MPTFSDSELLSSVRTKINDAITIVDGLGTGDNLLLTAVERTKLSGIETGATADQTGAEIVTAINTELGGITWQGGGGGGSTVVPVAFQASSQTDDIATGLQAFDYRLPFAYTLTAIRASVSTAPVGASLIVNVLVNGSAILTTPITIEAGSETSVGATTPPVIGTSSLPDDGKITVNVTQIGSTTAGQALKINMIGTAT